MLPLTFDAESHTYRLNGRVIPSVTTIINAILPGWQADEYYLQRGRAIHWGCALLDKNDLDWATVAPEIAPRVRAWQAFRTSYPARIEAIELSMAHATFRYAG